MTRQEFSEMLVKARKKQGFSEAYVCAWLRIASHRKCDVLEKALYNYKLKKYAFQYLDAISATLVIIRGNEEYQIPTYHKLISFVKELICEKGLNYNQFAELNGISAQTLEKIMAGNISMTVDFFLRIANTSNCTLRVECEEPQPEEPQPESKYKAVVAEPYMTRQEFSEMSAKIRKEQGLSVSRIDLALGVLSTTRRIESASHNYNLQLFFSYLDVIGAVMVIVCEKKKHRIATYNGLIKLIKEQIDRKDVTYSQFATSNGIYATSLNQIMVGKLRMTIDFFLKVATALNFTTLRLERKEFPDKQ